MSVYYYELKHAFCHATAAPVAMVEDLTLAKLNIRKKCTLIVMGLLENLVSGQPL